MGKRLKDMYPHATGWQMFKYKVKKFFRKLFIWSIIIASIIGIFKLGGLMNPASITLPPTQVIKEVEARAPIQDRIAGCESEGNRNSKGSHYDKRGQVRLGANTNGSVDIGKNQINNYAWGAKATEMGLNLMVEADNDTMSNWIYRNRGTEDWYSSKACWK